MNRERLLLVGVLAIIALWAFVLREKPNVVADVEPKRKAIALLPVKGSSFAQLGLAQRGKGVFTKITNEEPHARPPLHDPDPSRIETPKLEGRELPTVWPPTYYSVSTDRLGLLRRPVLATADADGTIELPPKPAQAGDGAGDGAKIADTRIDTWTAFGQTQRGRVVTIRAGGREIDAPRELPAAGQAAVDSEFHRLTALLAANPEAAHQAGVTEVRVRIRIGDKEQGRSWRKFPSEFEGATIGEPEGANAGWWRGLIETMRLPAKGYQARERKGRELLTAGVNQNDNVLIEWALYLLTEAKNQVPAAAAQSALKQILLHSLDAANRRNRQELVLQLAFEHLDRFPQDEEVIEYVGNILASRSFSLFTLAEKFFALAPRSSYAQRRRIEVLLHLGRIDDADHVLTTGRAGGGAPVDLLAARIALAKGDFESAVNRVRARTGGEVAAEANQILGAVAYAKGDAAGAVQSFLAAVQADPGRSTAFSDLGLALVVQGRLKDAQACFDRATELDPVDNAVAPRLGAVFGVLEAGDKAALDTLASYSEGDDAEFPKELLMRFYYGYAKEKLAGDLAGAAALYRSVLDDDHRYRVAIARLGMVQSRRVENGESGADTMKEAVAHLRKATEINAKDALLPYILGRFLMGRDPGELERSGIGTGLADKMFARAAGNAGGSDETLPLWAKAARAGLEYRDPAVEERRVKSRLQSVRQSVVDISPPGTPEPKLLQHPVYKYASRCLEIVKENETKVDQTWEFNGRTPDWKFTNRLPSVITLRDGLQFKGDIDYKGADPSAFLPLEHTSAKYPEKGRSVTAATFYELKITGVIPAGQATIGVALLSQASRGKYNGIQVRRKARTGKVEVRLDGGDHDRFKKVRGRAYVEMAGVPWPEGEFTVHLKLQGNEKERRQGRFTLTLNGVNVFEKELGSITERSTIFRGSRPIQVFVWAEGPDGTTYPNGLKVTKVVLTKAKK